MGESSTLAGRDQEKDELRRVLSSRLFSRAPTLSKMLAYTCEMYFAGQADRIKEYNIAVEALGRGTGFDSGGDSIVRVEAARLRKHLERYYSTEGANHVLQLRIAEVGYAPKFVAVAPLEGANGAPSSGSLEPEASVPTSQEPAPDEPAKRRHAGIKIAAAVLAAGVVGFGLLAASHLLRRPAPVSRTLPSQPAAAAGEPREIRIHAGSSAPRFIDTAGALWVSDDYFSGGTAFNRPDRHIGRTFDQSLYQTGREGTFKYAIPLAPGVYELHLHFAETSYGQNVTDGAEKLRLFDVALNGKPLLANFDIAGDAGSVNTADEKVFKDVSPAGDGYLRLEFSTKRNEASLNGIEILPGTPGKTLPIRIVCGPQAYYDASGRLWKADRYFLGGRPGRETAPVRGTDDPGLFANNRWGHFNYSIPVPEGSYRLTLRFVEGYWNSPPGHGRVFDVYCNGRVLESGLDIFNEAGGKDRALVRTFHGLKPNGQNKLDLTFAPVVDYAILYAIEVEDETP